MTALEMHAIQPRSFVLRTTQSRHLLGYSPNLLLELELPPATPNEVLVGDNFHYRLVERRGLPLTRLQESVVADRRHPDRRT